jgi:uncharacterized protein YjbI with pentapeptide repeats
METRLIQELRILLPSIDDADLVEAGAADAEGLRYRRVGPADWSRLPLEHISVLGCQFSGTSLRESVWEDVVVSGVLFEQVDLSSARLERAKLDRTHFVGCQLSGLYLAESSIHDHGRSACRPHDCHGG